MAIDPKLANPKGVCVLCGMQAMGFVVQYNPLVHIKTIKTIKSDINLSLRRDYNQFACCSTFCQNVVLKIITETRGEMPQQVITAMEQQAIRDAKQNLHKALVAIGADGAFYNQTAQNMEYVIWEVWQGLRSSMQTQSSNGEVPF